MPRWVDAQPEEAEEESSSEEEGSDVEEEDEQDDAGVAVDAEAAADAEDNGAETRKTAGPSGQRQKISIPLGKKGLVCHVRYSSIQAGLPQQRGLC